jgi:tRNA(adenine34) deaminase
MTSTSCGWPCARRRGPRGAAGAPVGAVVVRRGEVVGAAHNERELRQSPTAHAEILAIEEAAARIGHWRLLETTIYVTVEPCPMCAGAISQARVPRLVFGARDEKAGAAGTVFDIARDPRLNHFTEVRSRVLEDESVELLQRFFAERREAGEK